MRTTLRTLSAVVLALALGGVHAQSATPPVPAVPPAQTSASSPAKKELVQRVIKLQREGIDRLATAMTEKPAMLLAGRASQVISADVPRDRQEATAKEVQAEIQRYLKETTPLVRRSAQALAPATIGVVLESQLSEDELWQVVTLLESPAYAKYQQLNGEMQRSLQARLVNDARATVEPRVLALEKALGERLKAATQAAPPPRAPKK